MRVDSRTWVFAADNGGTSAWTVDGTRLRLQWHTEFGGTSPVIVDGLAFVYDPKGGLRVYEATTGRPVATLPCGGGHWNSPIVADGRIALPEGNANLSPDERRSSTFGVCLRLPRDVRILPDEKSIRHRYFRCTKTPPKSSLR